MEHASFKQNMGLFLSTPCREVDAEEGIGNNLQYAVGEMQVSSMRMISALVVFTSDIPMQL